MREKKVSLKDIAKEVGVSTALVSYVLNGLAKEKRVGKEVVDKINKAARELNYQPNQIARSLRKGSTNTLGLIVADISNPFFAQLARVIEDEAAKNNYTVVFGSSDENCKKSDSLIDTLLNRQVDGLIVAPTEGCTEHIISLAKREVPIVLFDRYLPELSTSHVVLNNYQATYSAVEHFLLKGFTKIKLVAYKSAMIHMQERIRGYKEAMVTHGLARNSVVKEVRYNHIKSDMEKIFNEIENENDTDAVLFATNALSLEGLYAIRKKNMRVPEDIGVIGFDGHEAFDFFNPALTYIQQPMDEMGKESVRILIEQIKGSKKIVQVVLKSELIERGSCG